MRPILALAVLAALSACASDEYSKVPEARGEWVPANPPGLTAPMSPLPIPVVARARWTSRGAAR